MPLMDGDIEVLSLSNRQVPKAGTRQFVQVKEIRFLVRGNEELIQIPLDHYTKEIGEQAILYAAAQIVDLLERFPHKG